MKKKSSRILNIALAVLMLMLFYSIGFTTGMNYGQAFWSPLVHDCVDYLKDCVELTRHEPTSAKDFDDIMFIDGEKAIQIRMYSEVAEEHELCPEWHNETIFCVNETLNRGYNYIEVIYKNDTWTMYVNQEFVVSKEVQYADID